MRRNLFASFELPELLALVIRTFVVAIFVVVWSFHLSWTLKDQTWVPESDWWPDLCFKQSSSYPEYHLKGQIWACLDSYTLLNSNWWSRDILRTNSWRFWHPWKQPRIHRWSTCKEARWLGRRSFFDGSWRFEAVIDYTWDDRWPNSIPTWKLWRIMDAPADSKSRVLETLKPCCQKSSLQRQMVT